MNINVGKAIKLVRTTRKMTQIDVAKKAGMTQSQLARYELGGREPKADTLQRIATALDVPLPILIYLAADKDEIKEITADVSDRLSKVILDLIGAS